MTVKIDKTMEIKMPKLLLGTLLAGLVATCGEPNTSELASGDEIREPSANLVASSETCENHYRRLAVAQLTYQQVSGFIVGQDKEDKLFSHCSYLARLLNDSDKAGDDHFCIQPEERLDVVSSTVGSMRNNVEYARPNLGDARGVIGLASLWSPTEKVNLVQDSIVKGFAIAVRFKNNDCESIDSAINKLYDYTLSRRKQYARLRNQCVNHAIKIAQVKVEYSDGSNHKSVSEEYGLAPCLILDHLLLPFIEIDGQGESQISRQGVIDG